MEVKVNTDRRYLVFYLEGGIDIVRASKIEKEVDKFCGFFPGFHLLFNFRKAGLVSSSGYGIVINFQRRNQEKGIRVAVSNLSFENKRIIGLMGIEGMIESFLDESEFEEKCRVYY